MNHVLSSFDWSKGEDVSLEAGRKEGYTSLLHTSIQKIQTLMLLLIKKRSGGLLHGKSSLGVSF